MTRTSALSSACLLAALVLAACPQPINLAVTDARVRVDSGIPRDSGVASDGGEVGEDAAVDASALDAGAADADPLDVGVGDALALDLGIADAEVLDAFAPDAVALDASPPDVGHLDPRLAPADPSGQACQFPGGSGECALAEVCRFYSPTEGRCESCTACGHLHDPCTRSADCDIVFVCYDGVCTNFCALGFESCGKAPCIDVGYPDEGVCPP